MGISIDTVVATVLEESPDIEQSRLAIEAGDAERMLAARPFDYRIKTSVVGSRDNLVLGGALAPTSSLTAFASGTKLFRSGIVISTDASHVRFGGLHPLPLNQSDSSVAIHIPLASGRNGGAAAGFERSTERGYQAALLDRSHVSALAVLEAVTKYWQYVATQEQLDIHRASAERAEALVEVTEALIRADERPASDRDLITSNLANKRTTESASEQSVIDARYALGVVMGLTADQVQELGPPLTVLPVPSDISQRGTGVSPTSLARTAIDRRRDLAAAQARRDGARLAWQGALRDLRPRWDVVAKVGHTSITNALDPMAILSPPVQGATGVNSLVQIQYEPIATNSAARGLALRTGASYQSSVVAADDLRRRIRSNVHVAAAGLDNVASEVALAEEAVRLSARSVETEEAKFRLGLATLFDAILSTDVLTNAQLRLTDARYRYAVALARLRFETGTLLTLQQESVAAETPHRLAPGLAEESR